MLFFRRASLYQPLSILAAVVVCSTIGLVSSGSVMADQKLPDGLFVEGYTDQLSYVAGDEVVFHLSGTGAVSMQIDRLGADRKQVYQKDGIAVSPQAIPDRASSHGCQWPEAFRMTVPEDWKSGYYEVVLTTRDQGGRYVGRNQRTAVGSLFFVVRSKTPGTTSPILIQLATNTYNAYTNWGGHSLYGYHDRDGVQGHRVSFDRPIQSQFRNWELPFIQWAEKSGYELDYAVNSDLESRPDLLSKYRLVLSVGHDEYWSAPMRDHLESYIADGGNVAFFSGNTCCWQVRSEDDGRALTSHKQFYNMDPEFRTTDHRRLSTAWGHHLVGRPENQLTGVGFMWGGYHLSHGQFMDGSGAYEVHRPEHWVFEKTDRKQGDQIGGAETVVGYECDGCEMEWRDGLPFATGRDGTPASFTILGTCSARWHPGDSLWYDQFPSDRIGAAVMGMYTQGGTVFTAGSTDWAHGLRGKTPVIEQITRNLLDRLSQEPK
ncbi:N,N-dimethylformamidase beta subunit [Rubripirellula lacrimiformis]|uniref:N,N-dimethylformamidase beta subunit n=1 Tax=Rubripirellula lacrimiformis TaxID=1930273 RepID=A0A517NF16_9BACT|nr:N,N-dimethylformamidase beta subunit family domain-containing protein [Rubripirellula lacrimiformis]QDT05719.1 N,N-dimethylformamidase beta subunit [Rubripirellula lacrimiformis]